MGKIFVLQFFLMGVALNSGAADKSKFKVNIQSEPKLIDTSLGQSKVTGLYIEKPTKESKVQSPVEVVVGFEIEGKAHPGAKTTDGHFVLEISRTKKTGGFEGPDTKNSNTYDLQKGQNQLNVNLEPGRYFLSVHYVDDPKGRINVFPFVIFEVK
jgi:hypothetical protein